MEDRMKKIESFSIVWNHIQASKRLIIECTTNAHQFPNSQSKKALAKTWKPPISYIQYRNTENILPSKQSEILAKHCAYWIASSVYSLFQMNIDIRPKKKNGLLVCILSINLQPASRQVLSLDVRPRLTQKLAHKVKCTWKWHISCRLYFLRCSSEFQLNFYLSTKDYSITLSNALNLKY